MSAAQGTATRSGTTVEPGRPARLTVRTRLSRAAFTAIAVGAVLTVAGCTSDAASTSALAPSVAEGPQARTGAGELGAAPSAAPQVDGEFAAAPDAAAPDVGATDGDTADASAPGMAAGQLTAPAIDGSKIIRTADLAIRLTVPPVPETDDAAADRDADAAARAAAVSQAAGSARGIATSVGGFTSSADGGGSTMTISLRVPADQYDAVLDRLGALGEVTNRTETSQDVTAEVVDVNSRVASMTASVARVRALLAQATTIAEVISIESELAVREANLESLQQQQSYLDGQVSLSTVTMTLTAVTDDPGTAPPVEEETGFVAGIAAGWAALQALGGWLGGAVGAILPFLPLVAAAGLLLWWLIRRARRRRAARSVTPPAPGPAAGGAAPVQPEPQPAGVGTG